MLMLSRMSSHKLLIVSNFSFFVIVLTSGNIP